MKATLYKVQVQNTRIASGADKQEGKELKISLFLNKLEKEGKN